VDEDCWCKERQRPDSGVVDCWDGSVVGGYEIHVFGEALPPQYGPNPTHQGSDKEQERDRRQENGHHVEETADQIK